MTAVVFDLGNVVVRWTPHAVLSAEFIEATEFFVWNTELDRGAPFAATIAGVRERFPQYADECDAFRDRWPETLGEVIQETLDAIDELRARGTACFALTNSSAETLPRSALVQDVLARLDGALISGDVGLLKPDPAIYRLAEEVFGLDPSTTWFVDDSQPNVDAAVALGWHGIHFTDPAALTPALVAAGLL